MRTKKFYVMKSKFHGLEGENIWIIQKHIAFYFGKDVGNMDVLSCVWHAPLYAGYRQ